MSYRPSAVQPRGRWASYLHQMRRDRDWSQQQAFEALREGLHLGPKSRASYVAIDMGHRAPTPAEATFLVRYFGVGPDDLPDLTSATEPTDAVVAAIDRQTAMLKQVLDALTQRTLDPTLVRALEQWGSAQASIRSQLSDDPAPGQSAPTP